MEDELSKQIDEMADEMKECLMELLTYPAIGPDNDGEGEMKKAKFLLEYIEDFGFDRVERYDAPDERVPSGSRPNIVMTKEGETDRNLIIVAHLDVVPEGDMDEWDTDPFDPIFEDGKIYGRGAEDNGQAVISAVFAAKALTVLNKTPKYNLKVVLVSDEETGNDYGVKHILDQDLFNEDDLVIVPDHSEEKGKMIEITEKSSLWVKITVHGDQGHAASPGSALNANRVAAEYLGSADKKLHEVFDEVDDLFAPPMTTIEPTKREANVPNVNTIPGKDTQYFDCRILPSVSLEDVKGVFEKVAADLSESTGADIQIEYIREKSAPEGTSEDAEVVRKTRAAIEDVSGFTPGLAGIGGGTVASHFRRKGIPAVVWITNDEMAHRSNEYAVLDYMVRDCKVFTSMLMN